MPSEAVTFVVSTGIGVSVIAGIISGVCYVVVHGLKNKKRDRKSCLQWHCTVCGGYLRSIEGVLEGEKVVTCSKCFSRVCKTRCSEPSIGYDQWTCQTCLAQNSWLQGLLNISRSYCRGLVDDHQPTKRLKAYCSKKMDGGDLTKNKKDDAVEVEANEKEKEQVRRYIERLVSDVLGESVDEARISRIYNDQQYDSLFASYHPEVSNALNELGSSLADDSLVNLPVIGQSAATAQATLKQIIERLLVEAAHLPSLKKSEEDLATSSSDERNETYEDLLATAILNKVVSSYQNKSPSPAPSTSSRISSSSRHKGESTEFFFGDTSLDQKYRNTDFDTTSVSSLEEWLQPSDSSLGSTKFIDKVSLTIQHRIEEGTPSESEDENLDDSEYFRTSSSLLLNDDSNWYLQRRQFQGTHSPVPVPMLVPNPTVEAKVLIGDKEVEDTSDLSDAPSDDFGAQESIPSSVKALLVTSKMVIGGKNSISAGDYERSVSDTESSGDSGVKDDREGYEEEEKSISPDEVIADASLNSLHSNTEQDTEYTERYASLPRTILKTPPSTISRGNKIKEVEEELTEKTKEPEGNEKNSKVGGTEDGEENEDIPFEGVYSKKEKEKWNHPVEMKNNPYSKDSIEKRLRTSDKFGRDYYTRQASNPSGNKNGTTERKLWFPKSYEDQDEDQKQDIFRAVPMLIEDEFVDKTVDDSNVSEITSDSDLSFVNYYDVENSKIYQQNTNGNHTEIRISTNTEGLLYQPIDPELVPPKEKPPEIPVDQPKEPESLHFVQTLEIFSESLDKKSPEKLEPSDMRITVNTPDLCEPSDSKNQAIILEAINDQVVDEKNESAEIPQVKPRTFQPPVAQKRNRVPTSVSTQVPNFNRNLSTSSDISDTPHPSIIHKKSDNTLIKKIYADPTVRSFAMISRGEQIPAPEPKAVSKKPEIISVQHKDKPSKKTVKDINSNNIDKFEINLEDSIPEVSITDTEWQSDGFSLEFSDSGDTQSTVDSPSPPLPSVGLQEDHEIVELKAKRLVASRLGEFSKSSPNLAEPPTPKDRILLFKESLPFERTMSVRDLMKRFETKETSHRKDKPVHSLTARSISKPIREKLKNQDSADEITESTA